MNNSVSESIAATVVRLAELNSIVTREPAFAHWHFAGFPDVALLQFFPINRALPVETRQAHAKAIARAFGGEWERDVCDGSWRNRDSAFKVILHYVDKDNARPSLAVDLGEPVLELPPVVEPVSPEAYPPHDDYNPRGDSAGDIVERDDIGLSP